MADCTICHQPEAQYEPTIKRTVCRLCYLQLTGRRDIGSRRDELKKRGRS